MQETIIIQEKFRGPPQSGNGGYVGGAFSNLLGRADKDAEVTLRSPIPLDKPLSVNREADQLTITDGDTLIAVVKQTVLEMTIPEPPSWESVIDASANSFSFTDNINSLLPGRKGFHPICFCCGAEHDEGLGVFAAPVGDQVAAIWQTKSDWANLEGHIPNEYLWTALDCPGQFAYRAQDIITGMLGRISAKVHQKVTAGETLMVSAWAIKVEGKKHFAGSAIFNQEGELIAEATTLWIGRRIE